MVSKIFFYSMDDPEVANLNKIQMFKNFYLFVIAKSKLIILINNNKLYINIITYLIADPPTPQYRIDALLRYLPLFTTMTIEEILNTDHFTALPECAVTEDDLNCQESDEEIERLPNISTLLRASEFIDLGKINDKAITADTATVQAIPATASTMPATATVQSEDSSDDLSIAQYLRKFLQKDVPQQDLTQHVTEFPQQEDAM